jgi:hypothetical protein
MDGFEGTLRLFAIINRAIDLDYRRSDLAMEEECRRMLKVVEGRTDKHGLARWAELCWGLGILLDKQGRLDEAFEWLSNALSAYARFR